MLHAVTLRNKLRKRAGESVGSGYIDA